MFTEFYQPLSFDTKYFVAPHAELLQTNLNTFALDRTVARLRLSRAEAGLDFGREIGNAGEFRLGAFRGLGEARVKVGDPAIPNIDFNTGGAFASLRFDTLDNAGFPRHGTLSNLTWTLSRPGFGADSNFDTVEGEFAETWSIGNSSLELGLV